MLNIKEKIDKLKPLKLAKLPQQLKKKKIPGQRNSEFPYTRLVYKVFRDTGYWHSEGILNFHIHIYKK